MTLIKKHFWLIVSIVLAILLLLQNCKGEPKTITVTTPAVRGVLKDSSAVKHTTIIKRIPYEVLQHDTIMIKDSVDVKILRDYLSAGNDSIKKLNVLLQAAKISTFEKNIENKDLQLKIFGTVQGEVKDVSAEYTIKPQTIDVKTPRQSRFGIGVSVGYGIDGKPYLGAGLNYNIIKL